MLLGACSTRQTGSSGSYILRGEGAPTVVFEAGLGGGKDVWSPVLRKVAAFTTIFAYDRRGYGTNAVPWNPGEAGGARTGAAIVAELHAMLENAGVRPPYVLVGHSLGGLYVSLFARTYPGEVAGLLLLDSMHPEQSERCQQYLPAKKCDPKHYPWWVKILIRLSPAVIRTEIDGAGETGRQIRAAGPLPPVPLAVVSHGKPPSDKSVMDRMWADLQKDLAAESPHSTHIIARKSGHNIHRDEPALVVQEIRSLVLNARNAEDKEGSSATPSPADEQH